MVKVEIIEGALTDVRVSGTKWTKNHVIAGRILRGASQPLNVNKLQQNLEALRVIYPLEQLNSRLEPGDKPGDAALEVKVKEAPRFHAGTRFRNDLPPSSGANQFDVMLASPNLLGYFDEADFDYGVYRFGQGESKFLPGDNYSGSYKIPVTVYDTKVGGFYRRSTASVQEEPFNVLGISSDVESYGLTLDQPIINTVNRQLVFSLSAEHKISHTFLFGQPFSFSVGPVNGESVVTAIRPAISFTQRDEKSVFSARFTTTFGINAWDATVHTNGHDAEFISFLAQAQYMRRLGDTRSTLVARVTGQYATDGLLPSEQMSVGGANTVRGYRENTLVRDSGIASTVEIRTPLFGDARRREWLVIAPFFDVGAGWNLAGSTPSPTSIMSTGIGLLSSPVKGVSASLQWGYGLREVKGGTGDAQDYGIHFNLTWWFL